MPGGGYYKTSYAADMPYQCDTVFKRFWLGLFIVCLCIVPFVTSFYVVHLINLVMLASIGALSINLLVGNTGLLSLGHGGFLCAGAFSSAVMVTVLGLPPWVTLFAAIVVGAITGLIAGLPAIRLRGIYLLMSSIAVHFIVVFICGEFETRAGQVGGITLPPLAFGPLVLNSVTKWYFFLLVVTVLATMFCINLLRSRVGRAWTAIRDRDIAAELLGVNIAYYKVSAFVFTSALTALAGSLASFYNGFTTVGNFTLLVGVEYLVMVTIGGLGSILGSFLGASFVTFLPFGIEAVFKLFTVPTKLETSMFAIQYGLFGIMMILFLRLESKGLTGIWHRIRNFFEVWPYKSYRRTNTNR